MLTSENSDTTNLKNIKICITFPFVQGEHVCYEKIYEHTMKWVANPSNERLIHMDGTGNFYDVAIDKLLTHDEHLDYPTCEFFYKDNKVILSESSCICKLFNTKTILRCNENLFSTDFENIDENILHLPPCNLRYLTIEIYGDLVYFTI